MKRFYTITEHSGSTYAIGVQAKDTDFIDKVDIIWKDVPDFADEIRVTRDGEAFVKLPATSKAFTDIKPIFGQEHEYGIVLVKNGSNIVAAYDKGGVNPNGAISGRVTSLEGNIATGNTMVVATAQIDGSTISDTVYTDATGYYEFTDVFYGENAVYILSVSLEGHTFLDNPRELTLNRLSPALSGIDFSDEYGYQEGSTAFGFSNLNVAANGTADYIQLDWDYARPVSGETVHFKIFRKITGETGSTLIALITDDGASPDQYRDLGGLPGTDYTYTVEAYVQQGDNVSQVSLEGNAIYPQAEVASITATANTTLGTVGLGWSHTSENFTGFNLYRDSALIATLDSSATTYTDLQGLPGTIHTYKIAAYVEKEGQVYGSALTATDPVTYPALPYVTAPTATPQPDKDQMQLTWTYPTVDTTGYNYDGVNIYRDNELIGTVLKTFPGTLTDKSGVPGTSYTYSFRTFKYNQAAEDNESSSVSATTTPYPMVKAPENLVTASGTHIGYIPLTWNHTSENHDGFVIERDGQIIAEVLKGTRTHKDVVQGIASHSYGVKAFREVDGIKYYSTATTDAGSAQADGGTSELEVPGNFTASDHLAGHILLEWEYPEYILSEFEIYRDGILLTTLPTDNRVYYDYTAEPDKTYIYQVQAAYEGASSYRAGDPGSLGSTNTISGMVVTQSNGRGVADVAIQAVADIDGNQYIRTVSTDASGHYVIENVPERAGVSITISASLQNHIFEQAQQTITLENGVSAYTASFTDLFMESLPGSGSVAVPVDVTATPELTAQNVTVRWNTNGANYSGFKVYRGLVEIADISAQHHREVVDSTGFPGQDYPYRVQAYWDEPYGLQESEFVASVATYPIIPPVEHLKAVQLEQEDKVQITWSHPSDKHDHYAVYRNDEPVGVVPTRQVLQFMDTTGLPGQVYQYSVVAVKNMPKGLFASTPVNAQVVYPFLSQVEDLTAEQPTGQHHLALSWQHLSTNVDGYLVYRGGAVIDTLAQGDDLSIIDRDGASGQDYEYRVTTFTTKQGLRYESIPVKLGSTYPELSVPTGLSATPDATLGTVNLSWSYTADDIEGYHIYRGEVLIVTLSGKANTSYTDITGTPNTAYSYTVKAFDIRDGQQYESDGATVNAIYPEVPAPTILNASDGGYLNHIEVTWAYGANNNDGFYIYRDGTEVGTLDGGKRSFREIFNQTGPVSGTYAIKAFRQINGQEYLSGASNSDAGSTGTNTAPAGLTNLTASRGEHLNKVSLGWAYTGGSADVEVYRDGEHLATVPATNKVYQDIDGLPGKEYVYRVVLTGNGSLAAIGYKKANGTLKGSVITQQGGTGVPGVTISAATTIDGQRYTYGTLTNAVGEFEIPEVYYEEAATYDVIVSYPGHSFVKDTLEADLELAITTGRVAPFIDKTAYLISGLVYRELAASCGIDSVKVTLKTLKGEQELTEETYTDMEGYYSFTINPGDPEVTQYQLTVAPEKTYTAGGNQETTNFRFETGAFTFSRSDIDNFALVKEVDFVEKTAYSVELVVQNTCGPIGTNRFDIRVSSTDGCFVQTYQTLDNGKLTVNLPPLDYKMVVTGAASPNPDNLTVVDYLRVRPIAMDLYSLHHGVEKGEADEATLEGLSSIFTYHKAPKVNITGLDRFLCDDPERPAIVKQGHAYTLNLNVFEEHSDLCAVNEGYLLVKNAAAEKTIDTLQYDATLNGFSPYTFTAGEPITIAPYTLGMVVEYHTENGGYQGEKIQAVIVEGEKSPPGNDIIVSVEESTIQLPLFILRDPPGDQSYSYIEKGKTFEKSLSISNMHSGGAGVKTDGELIIRGYGAYTETSVEGGAGNGDSDSFNVSVTTTQRIETEGDAALENNYISREQADVIVGTGLSTAYGITEKIEINDNCDVIKSTAFQLVPNGLTTDWHYSVFQIEKLIEEYKGQIEAIDNGTFDIEGLEEGKDPKGYLTALKNNWEAVLRYHRKETVPMCQVCNLDKLPEPFKSAVKDLEEYEEYKKFCDALGGFNKCELEKFTWTNELMERYNKLSQFKSKLEEGYLESNDDLISEYQGLYSPEVKNITFDGAAGAISNEVTVSKSQSRSLVQQSYFSFETFSGITFEWVLKTSVGIGAEVETEQLDMEFVVGAIANYNFEYEKVKENSTDTTATVGYVLDDDDDGDQFSVTVVKGIDPSHTPYFSVLGGRSSCPADPGTISRYDPQLFVELPDGSLVKEYELWDVDPEGPASFQLKMASGNLFDENLLYYLYAPTELNPNQNDAEIFLQIGGENDGTGTRYILPGRPQHAQIDIYRREGDVYDYTDIILALSPKCEEYYNTVADYIHLKVHFKRPCSPVSLVSDGNRTINRGGTADGDRWVINKSPVVNGDPQREQLFLKIVDYDPESQPLEDIDLEYRRAGANHWTNIVTLDKETLAAYYEEYILTYPNPTYPYAWDITELDLADGEYEIRSRTNCGTSGENFSNILTGIIDRTSLQVYGYPEPADGVLSPGDAISVTFNEAIDCALFDPATITVTNISDNGAVVNASAVCSGNGLAIIVGHATLAALDGDTLQVNVASAIDAYGNELEDTVTWQFTIHYEPVYWLPNTLEVDIFKGETATLTAQLFNTSGSNQAFALSGHEGLDWLTVSETSGTVLPSGLDIGLAIDTKTLDVGSYTQTLTAAITGYQDEILSLQVNVLPERPDWQVDLGQYPDNATVIANFNLDSTGLSTDTLDLISVWIGNSLRGGANIQKVSDNDYVAYLTVAGSPADNGKVLSFRVWDASTGAEYDGHAGQAYAYGKDVRYGTTATPVVLTVDSNADAPSYVPLRTGWNWFSVNTSQTDMSVGNVLKSLSPTAGDQIKTLNSTSSYSATLGWESLDGLDNIATDQGYLLYLAKADTLRLTGTDATLQSVPLANGWNLIGYPLQEASSVNEVLTISNLANGDVLKGDRSLAEYNGSLWNGMGQLQPYQSYMIHLNQAGLLSYNTPASPGAIVNRDKAEFGVNPGTTNGEAALSMVRSASDWSVDPTDYEYNMTFTGAIALEEGQEVYPGSKVVAFVGKECRGIGELAYIEALNRYEASLFVYANTEGEEVTFKIVDEEIAKVYGTVNKEVFSANTHHGNFTEPYLFQGGEVLSSSGMLMAYPNPFERVVAVKFNTEQAGNHRWVLRDEVGALVLSGEVEAVRGMNTLTLDLARELPAGVYLLSLTGTATHETIKLMKHD